MEKPIRLDGVNYSRRTISTPNGPLEIQGMTVRCLRKLLEEADPDDLVCYLAEQTDETRKADLLYGVISGCGISEGAAYLFGPEAVFALDAASQNAMPLPVDRTQTTTTNGEPLNQTPETDSPTGQHANYVILTESERAKGFVRPCRDAYRHDKCGTTTTMGRSIAETYARDPKFYGSTFCCHCKGHFPVGENGEFVWIENDGSIGPKVGA